MTRLPPRARAILSHLPADAPLLGAEVGVWRGQLSRLLLRELPLLTLYMVDLWHHDPKSHNRRLRSLSPARWRQIHNRAQANVAFAGERAKVVQSDSATAAPNTPLLDFAFIDDDHSYRGCIRSIAAWHPRIKPGGLLCGHDYNFKGVHRAVKEFSVKHSFTIETGPDRTWFIRLPQ